MTSLQATNIRRWLVSSHLYTCSTRRLPSSRPLVGVRQANHHAVGCLEAQTDTGQRGKSIVRIVRQLVLLGFAPVGKERNSKNHVCLPMWGVHSRQNPNAAANRDQIGALDARGFSTYRMCYLMHLNIVGQFRPLFTAFLESDAFPSYQLREQNSRYCILTALIDDLMGFFPSPCISIIVLLHIPSANLTAEQLYITFIKTTATLPRKGCLTTPARRYQKSDYLACEVSPPCHGIVTFFNSQFLSCVGILHNQSQLGAASQAQVRI
ncbi:hypothetical protein BKA93DRAFT_752000 [Sparassis latifolia]